MLETAAAVDQRWRGAILVSTAIDGAVQTCAIKAERDRTGIDRAGGDSRDASKIRAC